MDHLGELTDQGAVEQDDVQADQLVVVVLLRVVRTLLRVHLGDQDRAPQLLGGVAVLDAGEPQQQPPAVDLARLDGQRTRGGRVGEQDGTGPEPELGLVGADLDADVPLDAVGAADLADDELHGDRSPG